MNIKIFLLCPVPENQKPINEYIELQKDSLGLIFSTSKHHFQPTFFSISFCIFFIVFYSSSSSFSSFLFQFNNISFDTLLNIIHSLSISFFFTNLIPLVFLFFQFFRWSQLENKLNQARFFYEEGSWYDGEIWEKPFLLIKNERFLTTQKIQPVIQEISRKIFSYFFLNTLLIFSLFLH
jgi:hypothetical protein